MLIAHGHVIKKHGGGGLTFRWDMDRSASMLSTATSVTVSCCPAETVAWNCSLTAAGLSRAVCTVL